MNSHKIILILSFLVCANVSGQTLHWGINQDLDYFIKASSSFKNNVERRSNGKIKVEIEIIKKSQEGYNHIIDVQSNTYQMSQELVFDVQKHIPELEIWDLPYLFRNDEHVDRYVESVEAKKILKKLNPLGLVGLGYTYSGGFLHIFGDEINSFNELKNGSLGLENHSKNFELLTRKALNVKTGNLNHDMYSTEGKTKKGSEIIIAVGKKELFPLAKKRSFTLNTTNHRVVARMLFISKPFFDSLTPDLQTIILEEGERVAKTERQITIDDKNTTLREATANNIKLNVWTTERYQIEKRNFKLNYDHFIKRFSSAPINYVEDL